MRRFHYRPEGNGEWFTDPAPFSEVALALDDLFVVLDDVLQTMSVSAEDRAHILSVRDDIGRIEELVCNLDLAYRHKRSLRESAEPRPSV